jgi:ribonuclease HI
MSEIINVYTDGACKGNPGPGGWGVLMQWNGHEKELFGGEAQTTNNRMELRAVIEALAVLKRDTPVRVHTDSKYVHDGITSWIHNWKKRGWKTAGKKPVKNVDLWQQLDVLAVQYTVTWVWVKGHSGHHGNERADALANRGVVTA